MIVTPVDGTIHKDYEFFVKVYHKGGMTFTSDKQKFIVGCYTDDIGLMAETTQDLIVG